MSTIDNLRDLDPPGDGHVHHDGPGNFLTKYVFATDHKVIGLQFLFSSLIWLFVGGGLAMLIRWQLAWPGTRLPIVGDWLFAAQGGQISPSFYTMLFTMHGTVMIFLVIIPMLLGAFANYLIPLQIGYKDMAFPTLNMISYWVMWPGFVCFMASFFVEGGAAANGWTSYPPLANLVSLDATTREGLSVPGNLHGQTLWLLGIFCVGVSSMMGSVNYLTTIINCRAPGLTMFRLPLSIWALLVTSVLQAFALPVLTAATLMMLADRLAGTSFFAPGNQWVNGAYLEAGGGSALLWQHLFWFYSHPAVYIMILPAMGIVSEVLSTFSRKPVFGYRPMVFSMVAIAVLGFVVWGHHMFASGMNPAVGMAFMLTTIFIALPSAIKTFNWIGTLWGGAIEFATPLLHAVAFVSMFIIGGLSGIFMALTPVDVYIHDTYFIVAHFHFILAGSSLFGIFAGMTYWFPKMFGRMMNETLGKLHFALTFVFLNGTFLAMHQLGAAGMPRRLGDPYQYEMLAGLLPLNQFITFMAFGMGAAQLLLVANFLGSIFLGKRCGPNPWRANGLEWAAPSPPPHGNFPTPVAAYRPPHEYSSPETKADFLPQWLPPSAVADFDAANGREMSGGAAAG